MSRPRMEPIIYSVQFHQHRFAADFYTSITRARTRSTTVTSTQICSRLCTSIFPPTAMESAPSTVLPPPRQPRNLRATIHGSQTLMERLPWHVAVSQWTWTQVLPSPLTQLKYFQPLELVLFSHHTNQN